MALHVSVDKFFTTEDTEFIEINEVGLYTDSFNS